MRNMVEHLDGFVFENTLRLLLQLEVCRVDGAMSELPLRLAPTSVYYPFAICSLRAATGPRKTVEAMPCE